ncbi:double-strand break repair protein MRE11, putative [Plasmodium gallinaceum]|uniref:Double-strand break repair protein MRE11, putative n=1 Tax=Plasmodium gallinaceum TaxID=5849 RepID=A0A1J1GLP6_PLAGA|nr:double-strand break repair protein MRE11, putative [Plasmodium gallinaceum]CRG93334.1 double-strand break repair protein MRE11, putative [Plasmodium gallinaceum]
MNVWLNDDYNNSLCENDIDILNKKNKIKNELEMNKNNIDNTKNENIANNFIKNTNDEIYKNSSILKINDSSNINRNNVMNKKKTRIISIKNLYSNLYKISDTLLKETINEKEEKYEIDNLNYEKDKYAENAVIYENKLNLENIDINDTKKKYTSENDINISEINRNKLDDNSKGKNKKFNSFLKLYDENSHLKEHSNENIKNNNDNFIYYNNREENTENRNMNNHCLNLNGSLNCDNEKKFTYKNKKNTNNENSNNENCNNENSNNKNCNNENCNNENSNNENSNNENCNNENSNNENSKNDEQKKRSENNIESVNEKDERKIDNYLKKKGYLLEPDEKKEKNMLTLYEQNNNFLDEQKEKKKKYNLINEQEGSDLFKNMKINELKAKLSENLPDTFKILLCTDNHLGYKENNSIQKKDSFNSFEEILFIAKKLNVDMILNSGDLFHKNKVSEYTLFKSMSIMRKYCHINKKENWVLEEEKESSKKKLNTHVKEITNYEYEYYENEKVYEEYLKTESDFSNEVLEEKKNKKNKKEKKKKKKKIKEKDFSSSNTNDKIIEKYGKKKKKKNNNKSRYEDDNESIKYNDSMYEKYEDNDKYYYNKEIIKDLNGLKNKKEILNNLKICSLNEKYEKSIPFFTIHGNHDYPYSYDFISPLDILNISNLINYIGKNSLDNIVIKPILLNKNKTKISIYAIGWMKDERLYRSFENNKVKFVLPSDYKNRINILVLHQNRYIRNTYGNNTKNFIKESFVPKFIDLVIWGHEHFSKPYLEESIFNSFYNLQLGSSVRTSLCPNEYGDKYIGLLEIRNERFRFLKINLETVRPFELKDIRLGDFNLNFKEEKILKEFLHEQTNIILNDVKKNLNEEIKKYYLFKKLFFPFNGDKNDKTCIYKNKEINELISNKINENTMNSLFEKPEEREKYFYSILSEDEIHNFYSNLKNEDFYSSTFIHMAFSDCYDTFDLIKIKKYVYEKPLIKLKVEYDDINIINTQSFGSLFISSIANPSECLSFYKKKIKNRDNMQCIQDNETNDKDLHNMEYINEYNKVFDILFDYCDMKNKLSILDEKVIMDTMQNFILNTNSSFNSNSNSDFNSIISMVDKCSKDKIDLLEQNIKDIPIENLTDDYLKNLTEKLNNQEFFSI